jgi:hypothetical protein
LHVGGLAGPPWARIHGSATWIRGVGTIRAAQWSKDRACGAAKSFEGAAMSAKPSAAPQPAPIQPDVPEGIATSEVRIRDADAHWPRTVANPRRVRVR